MHQSNTNTHVLTIGTNTMVPLYSLYHCEERHKEEKQTRGPGCMSIKCNINGSSSTNVTKGWETQETKRNKL